MPKFNLFKKMMALILVMLIPIMGLYVYSNQTSTEVLREELHQSSRDQLRFFQHQVDTTIQSISLWPNLLLHDPDISELKDIFEKKSPYLDLDTMMLIKRIQQKLSIQQNSLNWISKLMIYSPTLERVITASGVYDYNHADLKKRLQQGWQVRTVKGADGEATHYFSLITVSPFSSFHKPEAANLIIEVEFDSGNIRRMLDTFRGDGERNPFYYKEETGIIFNSVSDESFAEALTEKLRFDAESDDTSTPDYQIIDLDGESFLVNAERSSTTGWMLVDYLPLSDVLMPIKKSNLLFYTSAAALLIMSLLVVYLIYAQVQVPIKQLVTSFRKLKNEDYSVRLKPKGDTEFSFLFTRFNAMAAQIQDLFGRVYLEKIHVKEARLKQLQSQINPHFFYNCFSFISSMAKLQNYPAIIAMTQNLSDYYRYTTRQEREFVALSEELELVGNYLDIQQMRMKRLSYEVYLPPWLRQQRIPPLVIQPLVENAVLHGIEPHLDAGRIVIRAEERDGGFAITVDDDGQGIVDADMLELQMKLARPMDEEMGCGLWNVHQRLHIRYGPHAGLAFSRSPLGGLRVTLTWSAHSEGDFDKNALTDIGNGQEE
ncbi:histidine kinase [Paenibacillus sp. LHD-117]|uniref:sensor histidine kinase n=1 Tax=Paenibacillus sp. LHD-117 TaxID=3071412 RepID=UPI0027DEAE90|nr:histidine kinase [Paenibacillus sp. LHD-117]MDQ6419481.1 histidine kinase [Paenibacillus sp. LHD-117]